MFPLIGELSPKERAILFQSLELMQVEVEQKLLENQVWKENAIEKIPLTWMQKNIKELKQKLFSECFTDDLEPLQYFLKEQTQNAETNDGKCIKRIIGNNGNQLVDVLHNEELLKDGQTIEEIFELARPYMINERHLDGENSERMAEDIFCRAEELGYKLFY